MTYDYLIVGSGLFGSVFAREMTDAGKKCLVIEKKSHIGGLCYSEDVAGIHTHRYGPHIFHTNDKAIWDYVNRFVPFRQFKLKVTSCVNGELFSFPINLMTLHKRFPWVETPEQAKELLDQEKVVYDHEPKNLEEQALSQIGHRLYDTFIYEYTKKQWGKEPKDLPASIIKRIPVRWTADDNYYYHAYQGMPRSYTELFERLLDGIEVRTSSNFHVDRGAWLSLAPRVVYTGPVDEYFDYKFGPLEYRSIRFETEVLPNVEFYQGSPLYTFPTRSPAYTRISEWKHFHPAPGAQHTVITREFPTFEGEPLYPINDERNDGIYSSYRLLTKADNRVILGGRLGRYRYYDMDQVIAQSLKTVKEELQRD